MSTSTVEYFCVACGRRRTARRCGCQGTSEDAVRWLSMAQAHREAAEKNPAFSEVHLADADRLERLALQGEAMKAGGNM